MSVALLNTQEAMRLMGGIDAELGAVAASLAAMSLSSWEGSAGAGAKAALATLRAQVRVVEGSAQLAAAALAQNSQALEAMEAQACWYDAMATLEPAVRAFGAGS